VFVSTLERNKTNLGSFEGHVSPNNYTFLITTVKIKQPIFAHSLLANEHVTEIKGVIANNKLLTDTCSLGNMIKEIQ
jgi:hypothetical protein